MFDAITQHHVKPPERYLKFNARRNEDFARQVEFKLMDSSSRSGVLHWKPVTTKLSDLQMGFHTPADNLVETHLHFPLVFKDF